jgi:3-isopropylmalate/(R)-2-methylmalate dehydratase small subunit
VDQGDIELIWKRLENEPGLELTVDLADRTVTAGDLVVPFQIDEYTRWRLMEGLDDIGLTLREVEAIDLFEQTRPAFKPTTL